MLIKTFCSDITSSRYIIRNLVNQDLTVKYKRSVLGFFWSVLNPLANMLICSFVFGSVMRFDLKDFIVFLYAGMLPWGFFSQSVEACASSIIRSEGFIKKIYLPKAVFPISTIISIFINTLFSFIALFFVVLIVGAPLSSYLLFLPISFLILFVFVVGLALLASTVSVFFRDVPYLINIVLSAWYYLTPILYPINMIPENLQPVFYANPMYYFIQLFRCPIYERSMPDGKTLLITIGLSLVSLILGLWVFYKKQDDFVYRL